MTRPSTSSRWRPSCPGCTRRRCAPTTASASSRPAEPPGRGRRYSLRDILILREIQRLSQEEGINLQGIKRILELELAERRSRLRLAELQAEISQLRAELESTSAVAARLAALLRTRGEGGTLVPVRDGQRPRRRPPTAGGAGDTTGIRSRARRRINEGRPAAAAGHADPG